MNTTKSLHRPLGDWKRNRLKHLCQINPSKSDCEPLPTDLKVSFVPMERVTETGEVRTTETRKLEEVWQGFTYFRDGDVIIAKITPCFENGKGGVCRGLENGIGFGSTEFHVLRPIRGTSPAYLFYVMQEDRFRRLGAVSMYGVAGQQRVPEEFLQSFVVDVPLPDEQQIIADFLDRRTGQIDEVIEKKLKLIELLQQKRQALISQIVTKGLDPAVATKDSGLWWLPRIPLTWSVLPNGRLFWQRDQRGEPDLPLLVVSLNTGVTLREFSDGRIERIAEDFNSYKVARRDDIAFNKMRMWQGAVGVAPTDGLVSPDYVVAGPNPCVHSNYYQHLFRTVEYMTEVNRYSRGIALDRNRLYWDEFKQMKSVVPPLEEQRCICDFIDRETRRIDGLIAKNITQIDKLREYRQTLISAAVTGKIDVRKQLSKDSSDAR